jgi:protein tyrosine phosphatase (PTP) superfamily phosphohydrolase (DUF442 family)
MTQFFRHTFGAALAIALLVTPAVSGASPLGGPPVAAAELSSDPATGTPAAVVSASAVAATAALPAPADSTVLLSPAPAAVPAPPTIALAGAGAPLRFAELPNLHQVDESLYRGGQPTTAGWARLKTLGVRTVLNLRYERPQIAAERREVEAAGLRYFNIPMYGLLRPTNKQIADALAIIHDPENQPVFVHCVRGADRTGAVVACYRIEQSKWTAERAIQEAMTLGMLRIEVPKRSYIRAYYAKLGAAAERAANAEPAAVAVAVPVQAEH